MKNLKKVTAGFLSLSLLTCVGVAQVFAAEGGNKNITALTNGKDQTTFDATVGTVTQLTGTTYNVNLTWGSFTYNYKETEWDTKNHYIKGEWSRATDDADKITITNNSSKALYATLDFTPEADSNYKDVQAVYYSNSDYNVEAINPITLNQPTKGSTSIEEVYIKLTGYPISTPEKNDKIGTVTVTVSDSQNPD